MESKITRKALAVFALATCLATVSFMVAPVGASYFIYIRADGSVSPPSAFQRDGDTYTQMQNFPDVVITVERSNIIIDGNGYILGNKWNDFVFHVVGERFAGHNVTIQNIHVIDGNGVFLDKSLNSSIRESLFTRYCVMGVGAIDCLNPKIYNNFFNGTIFGIFFLDTKHAYIYGNNMTQPSIGFCISIDGPSTSSSIISENNITSAFVAIGLAGDYHTIYRNTITGEIYVGGRCSAIYHNNMIDVQAHSQAVTTWDHSYPSGGNYWSDYEERYPNATEIDDSGIWNTPYEIEGDAADNCPLMNPWTMPTEPYFEMLNIIPYKTVVGQNCSMEISVMVDNHGMEGSYNLHILCDGFDMGYKLDIPLQDGITFSNVTCYMGLPFGDWQITAEIFGNVSDYWTSASIYVGVPCDISGPTIGEPDGVVNMRDIGYMCDHFATRPEHYNWEPNCDVVYDYRVDMRDIGLACMMFGERE